MVGERRHGRTKPESRSVPRQRRRARAQLPPTAPSDADLLARLHEGETSAYDELYRRHAEAVRRYARTCCREPHTADDLTNEVFARTLIAVRRGSGPRRDAPAVRAYLLTSVRRVAAAWAKTERRELLVEDFAVFAETAAGPGAAGDDAPEAGADVLAMRRAERSLVVQAFLSLPEKYRTVLWHTAVEDESPRDVAPLLGISDNAAAVLAHRAREKLRQAYLQAHVSASPAAGGECARYADRLGAYARGALRTRAELGLRQHMAECARCRAAAAELAALNERLRSLVPMALIGWFAAGGAKGLAGLAVGGSAAGAAGAGAAAAAASGGAAEGVTAPVKAGIAAGLLTAAGVAVALVLVAGGGTPPPPAAKTAPSQAPVAPASPSPRPPSHRPSPTPPSPTPHRETPTSAPPPSEQPVQAASQSRRPVPPTATKPSEPSPPPASSPPPAPEVYPLYLLSWSPLGRSHDDVHAPTLRAGGFSGVWQREGLRIGGTRFAHGVTVPAPSSVTVDLHRACTAFDALAGLDDLALRTGSVTFTVYGDGKRLWSSAPLRGGHAAVPVHVPLDGVSTLRLTTTPRGLLGVTAAADWASSRISCR
jgi:RNA polymerase sigma factor (sigma-70 family)